MPFSHHSHSGQFCPGHARNTLEEMLTAAISKKMSVFALTEHMPRHETDFYPEERAGPHMAMFEGHIKNESGYFKEALRLRDKYQHGGSSGAEGGNAKNGLIRVPIGFESDWIREGEGPEGSLGLIERSLSLRVPTGRSYAGFDFLVGSVHHVHTIGIDYTREDYVRAREISGGSDERLFEDYFDAQFAMLRAVRPPVVGHLDLIRLMSEEPDGVLGHWQGVWERLVRNLDFIVSYGGLVELNFSAVRKGMREPYPRGEVCRAFMERGGRFVVSDDSHGVDQVAFGYDRLLPFLEQVGIKEVCFLGHAEEREERPNDARFPHLVIDAISVGELREHPFWTVDRDTRKP
jgi:histidinol-phosphatase (PHP family)